MIPNLFPIGLVFCPIAFDTFTALHDIVVDGVNGNIIARGDNGSYAEKLVHLIKSEETRVSLASTMIRIVEQFRIEKVGTLWVNLLDNL